MEIGNETLGFWEKILSICENYGYWKLTKNILFIGFAIAFLCILKSFVDDISNIKFFNREETREVFEEVIVSNETNRIEEHTDEMGRRQRLKPEMYNILKETLLTMNADRAFVIELHNGTNNATGLPFIHCTMTYEEVSHDVMSIDEDYQNITLSRFQFPIYLHRHSFWFGTIEEFREIDNKAALRMRNNDVTYLVLTTLSSENYEIGYFGFTYCNGKQPRDTKEILENITITSQKISRLLDKNIDENML